MHGSRTAPAAEWTEHSGHRCSCSMRAAMQRLTSRSKSRPAVHRSRMVHPVFCTTCSIAALQALPSAAAVPRRDVWHSAAHACAGANPPVPCRH